MSKKEKDGVAKRSDDGLREPDIQRYEQQIAELTGLAQKTRADFENYRKHVQADIELAKQRAQQKMVNELLPIIDTIEAATANVPDEIATSDWVRGITAMRRNVEKLLADLQVQKISVDIGDKFDHNLHEAVVFEPSDDNDEVITAVLRSGYLYHGQLLRPAMVRVG